MAISYAELKRRAAKAAAKISKEYGEDAYGGLKFLNDPDGWKKTVQQQQKSKKPTQNRNSGWSRSGLSRDAYDARVRSRAAEKLGRYGTGFQSLDEAEEKLSRWSEELTQQQALLRQVGDAREKTGKQITQLSEKMTKNAGKDWSKSSYGDDSIRLETLKSAYSQLEADYHAREEVLMRTYRGLQAGKNKLSSMIGEQEELVRDANRTLTTPDWIMADRAKKNTAAWDKKTYGTQVWEMPTTADALLEVAKQAQAAKEKRLEQQRQAQKKSFGEASREWEKKAGDAVKSLFVAEPAQKKQSMGQRAWNTIAAAGTGLAAQFAGVPAYVVGRAGEGEAKAVQRYADAAKRYRQMAKDKKFSQEGRAHYAKLAEEAEAIVRNESGAVSQSRKDAQKMYAKVDKLSAVSEGYTAAAKDGLSAVGRFGVDAAVGGLQLLADIGLGAVTGGGALVPMAVRGFGGASQEARRSDTKADTNQQGLYGLASAGLSLMTEKVSNVAKPLAKAFGKGVADDALEAGIRRAFDSLAKTPGGKQAAQRLASMVASGTGEGFEEALEGALTPVLQRMIYDPKAQWDWAEIAREGLLGAAIGGVAAAGGGAGEHEWNQSHPGKAAGRHTQPESVQEALRGVQEGYDTPAVRNALETQKTAPPYTTEEADRIRYEGRTFKNLVAGLDSSVSEFFRRWKNGRKSHQGEKLEKLYLGKLSDTLREDVSSIVGYDVGERDFIITNDDVKHIFDHHGDEKAERAKGNLPITSISFDVLTDVVQNPSAIYKGHIENNAADGRMGIVFEKTFDNGTVVYIQFDNAGRKTLQGRTMYIKEAGGTPSAVNGFLKPNTFTPLTTESVPPAGVLTEDTQTSSTEATATSPVATTVTQAASGVKAEAGRPVARQVYDGLLLENAGETFGENGAKALRAAYGETRGEVSASDYYGGFAQYYQAGLTGTKPEQVRSDSADVLTQAQKFAAYTAGQNDAAASLAQERQAARFASTAGKESGLVYDAFVQEAIASGRQQLDSNGETRTYLTAETAETLNQTAKALGVRVRFVDSVAAGKANAQIRGSEVLVERNNPNPVRFLLGHEFTHRLQQLAPGEYRAFRDAVLQGKEQLVQARMDSYGRQGVELDYESAMDEVAADYAGLLMDDGRMLDRFVAEHRENRTLLEKIRDVFRQLAAKLTGAERRKAQTAAGKLEAALEAAAAQNRKLENAKTGGKKSTAGEGGEVRTTDGTGYSLKTLDDGRVVAVMDDDILSHIDTTTWDNAKKAQAKTAAKTALLMFKDGVQVSGVNYKVNRTSRREYTRSEDTERLYRKDRDTFADKMRMADVANNIITATTDWARDGKLKHPRTDNFVDFVHSNVLIQAGDNQYDARTVVGVTANNEYIFYDVVDMKPTSFQTKKELSPTAAGKNAISDIQESSFDNKVPQNSAEVKGKFSLKADNQGRELTEAQQEYFKDSKAVNEDGKLKVMYRGGNEDFTVFDRKKSSYSNLYGRGFYFTDSEAHAKQYGDTKAYYLNITNPVSTTETTITRDQMHDFLKAVAADEDEFSFENYGYDATVSSVLESVYGKSDFAMLNDVNQTAIGDMVAAVELFNEVNGTDYDGLILDTETVVFQSNQIKSITNQKPTSDPDIRFSMKLSPEDILTVQSIGRKSVNAFDSKDIATTEKFARMYWNEMGEKSPFFRSWFGDWRVNDTTPVQIATQRGDARGVQVNDDTGWSIQVSGKVFNETKGHRSAASTTARPYLPYINDIIKKAVLLDSYALDKGKEKSVNSLLMHSMYAVADIGNGREILKLYVEEMNDPNQQGTGKRAYQLQNIERQQSGAVGSGASPSLVTRTAGSLTVADIFSTVKRLDKNFRPNPESKIVDAEGKPLVMYHGTRAENGDFTVFDYSKAAKKGGLGLKALGKGNYFTSEKLDGSERYGSRVIPAYLDIKNPFIFRGGQSLNEQVEQETGIRTQGMDTAALQDAMREQGYDGVVQYQKDGTIGVAVAFDSNQIKSAVDNIGTFDKANPDIRFSLKQDGAEDAETILRGAGGRGTMGGKQDSQRGKYWKPKLSRREWSLLHRKLEQGLGEDSHFLDEATKWTYADERGDKVFALYGIGDGTEATPLYAVGGKEATAAYERLLPQLEDLQDGFDGNKKDVNQWIASVRSDKRNGRSYLNASERSGATTGRTDRLHGGTSERNTKRASGADAGDYTRGRGDGGDSSYSLKAGTVNKRAAALAEENRMLREQLGDYKAMLRENGRLRESRDHWKKQTQRSKAASTDEKAVAAAAKKLVQDYGAQVDTKQVQAQLQGLYDFIARGHDGKNELSGEAAYRRAEAIATDIVENAVTQDREMFDLYSGLRDYLKNTKIAFGKEYQSEIGDYQDFRRGLLGKVRLHQDGTPIDQVYTEMAELWPEFFDEQEQSRTCRIFLFGDCKQGDFVLYCFCVSVCEIQADKSLNSLERGYANSGNRPRHCNRWIWCFGCGAGTAVSGSLRRDYNKSRLVFILPSGANLCGYAGTDLHLFAPGNGGRGVVLFQQHHDRYPGRPWPRRGAAGRVSVRAAHCGVHAHAGQAGCCRIWQGGKAPGHGYGAPIAASAGRP